MAVMRMKRIRTLCAMIPETIRFFQRDTGSKEGGCITIGKIISPIAGHGGGTAYEFERDLQMGYNSNVTMNTRIQLKLALLLISP